MRGEQLEQPIALKAMGEREERVRPRDAEELPVLGGAAGRGAGRLTEHEVGGPLLLGEFGDRGDDVLVPVEDQQVVDGADVASVLESEQVAHLEDRAAVLRVVLVEEVDPSVLILVDVLEVRGWLHDGTVDRRFEARVQPEGLREAAVLRAVGVAAGHQTHEVVLDRPGAVLRRERRRRLARARQADDHEDLVAVVRGDDLEPGVQGEPALLVDDVVPHPEATLLGLPEVIRMQDAGDVMVEIDRDHTIVRVSGRGQPRRVDDLYLGLATVASLEVELLLHPRDVRVALLHHEAGGRPHLRIVADEAVDHDHVVLGQVLVLEGGDLVVLRTRHGLAAGLPFDDVGAARAPGQDRGLDVEVAELREAGFRHGFGEGPELLWGRVVEHLRHVGPPRSFGTRRNVRTECGTA